MAVCFQSFNKIRRITYPKIFYLKTNNKENPVCSTRYYSFKLKQTKLNKWTVITMQSPLQSKTLHSTLILNLTKYLEHKMFYHWEIILKPRIQPTGSFCTYLETIYTLERIFAFLWLPFSLPPTFPSRSIWCICRCIRAFSVCTTFYTDSVIL